MELIEYQQLAQRTSSQQLASSKIENGILGLCGESGECADLYKKYLYQDHGFSKTAVIAELGDVLWYCAELAAGLGVTLEDVAWANIEKLRKRYPDGFEVERSVNREEKRHVEEN